MLYTVLPFWKTVYCEINIADKGILIIFHQNFLEQLCDPFYNYNYAIVWSAELSDLVNVLNINWNGICPIYRYTHLK